MKWKMLVPAVAAALLMPMAGTALAILPPAVDLVVAPNPAAVPGVVVDAQDMHWVANVPQAVGSDLEFLERQESDGSLSRYAIVGDIGFGFQIIDITDPETPTLTGAFVDPGIHWQGDIQVNPRRNIVVIATDGPVNPVPAGTVGYGGPADGIAFVDISDLANPQLLSVLPGLGGSHNSTIIDDQYLYTALPTHIVDYSDPENPVDLGESPIEICGHDITLDHNRPDRIYSACSGNNTWQIINVSAPVKPKLVARIRDSKIATPHQADPSPNSSLVVVTDERGGGVSHFRCPGGGAHIYDISGKYTDGAASETNPIKIGTWFSPFTGAQRGQNAGEWGNCTMHNMTFQPERFLLSAGWYTAGAWVVDLQAATAAGGPYTEYSGTDPQIPGNTTWGNTQAHAILAGDQVWSTKWTRFDDAIFEEHVFNSGLTRGFDVLHYAGALPKKVARLAVDETASGAISGKLDRYAVWTYDGWVNKPLAGETVTVTVDGAPAGTAATGEDGTFSVAVEPGTHTVTVAWDGNDDYQPSTVTQTVTP